MLQTLYTRCSVYMESNILQMSQGFLPHHEGYQVGRSGKEGTVYKTLARKRFRGNVCGFPVRAKRGTWLAVKRFKPKKSFARICREASFQQQAAQVNVAPCVFGVHEEPKCIVMECGDALLVDVYRGMELPDSMQLMICALMGRLDACGILHNDGNARNLVLHNDKVWLIDYGFAKKLPRGKSNITVTLWALLRSLKRFKIHAPLIEQCINAPEDFIEAGEQLLPDRSRG